MVRPDAGNRDRLESLADWAEDLARTTAITLYTYFGADGTLSLKPVFTDQNVGLVTGRVWVSGAVGLRFWRSVFERRAPDFIDRVEALLGDTLRTGNQAGDITPELLDLLRAAYLAAGPGSP